MEGRRLRRKRRRNSPSFSPRWARTRSTWLRPSAKSPAWAWRKRRTWLMARRRRWKTAWTRTRRRPLRRNSRTPEPRSTLSSGPRRKNAGAAWEIAHARTPYWNPNIKTCPSRTDGAGVHSHRPHRLLSWRGIIMSNRNGIRVVRERERLDFAKIKTAVQIPNLIDVQKKSYQRFLQMDLLPSEREDAGLQSVFASVFPIQDFRGLSQLDFVDYAIGNWECKCGHLRGLHHLRATCRNCGASVVTNPYKTGDVLCAKCGTFNKNTPTFCNKCGDPVTLQLKYDVTECEERGMTYSAPLKVTIRLTIYDKDADTGAKSIRDIKEQEVFFGDIPLMTENGTFVINGTERVIVSQLHRSPGVFFETANILLHLMIIILLYLIMVIQKDLLLVYLMVVIVHLILH